jgi:glycosidase
MLLIYNGQESAFNERLKFFVKDTINWDDYSYSNFYRSLTELKENSKALYNGTEGGTLQVMSSPADSNVFAFIRQKENDKVLVICNLGEYAEEFTLHSDTKIGKMKEIYSGTTTTFKRATKIALDPWQYYVYENE